MLVGAMCTEASFSAQRITWPAGGGLPKRLASRSHLAPQEMQVTHVAIDMLMPMLEASCMEAKCGRAPKLAGEREVQGRLDKLGEGGEGGSKGARSAVMWAAPRPESRARASVQAGSLALPRYRGAPAHAIGERREIRGARQQKSHMHP